MKNTTCYFSCPGVYLTTAVEAHEAANKKFWEVMPRGTKSGPVSKEPWPTRTTQKLGQGGILLHNSYAGLENQCSWGTSDMTVYGKEYHECLYGSGSIPWPTLTPIRRYKDLVLSSTQQHKKGC